MFIQPNSLLPEMTGMDTLGLSKKWVLIHYPLKNRLPELSMKVLNTTLLLLLISCTADKQTDTATEITDVAPTPTLGDWTFSNLVYSEDSCNFGSTEVYSVASFEANVYTLLSVTDSEAQYVDANGLEFNCTVDGAVITCPSTFTYNVPSYTDENGEIVVDEEGNPVVPDATNAITTDFVTQLTTDESGTLHAVLTATCEGEDCQQVFAGSGATENPCSSTLIGDTRLQ